MASQTYDESNFTIVSKDSPRATQPDNLSVKLFPHQLAMVKASHDLESGVNIVEGETAIDDLSRYWIEDEPKKVDGYTFKTKIGVIADLVGSGKTFITMGIVNTPFKQQLQKEDVHRMFRSNYWELTTTNKSVDSNPSMDVIVVPKSLFVQWEKTLTKHAEFQFESVKSKLDLKRLHGQFPPKLIQVDGDETRFSWDCLARRRRCILISCNQFTNTIMNAETANDRVEIDRLFYDEADMIKMGGFQNQPQFDYIHQIATIKFTWLVSSTIESIVNCHRYRKNSSQYELFKNVTMLPSAIRKHILLRSNDRFIQESFKIPQPIIETILCRNPRMANLLHGVVDRNVMNAINAGDLNSALTTYGGHQVADDDALIAGITAGMEERCEVCRSHIEAVQNYVNLLERSDNHRRDEQIAVQRSRLTRYKNELKSTQERIKTIQERLTGTDTSCPICLDPEMDNKTVLKCCQNAMCFGCFAHSISIKSACPLCRAPIRSRDDAIIVSGNTDKSGACKEPVLKQKEEALKELLNNIIERDDRSTKKILLYSEYSFHHMFDAVQQLGITPTMFGGTVKQFDRVLTKFKKSLQNECLMLNAQSSGAGLNIQEATDIVLYHNMSEDITLQVMGRAQRFGRKGQLRIWRMANEKEAESIVSVDRLLNVH